MDSSTYKIPAIKEETFSPDERRIVDFVSQFPRRQVLKALFPYLTTSQIEDLERKWSSRYGPAQPKIPEANVLDYENPESGLYGYYFPEINWNQPFMVKVKPEGKVSIYRIPESFFKNEDASYEEMIEDKDNPEEYYNMKLVKEYRARKVFLGEDVEYGEHTDFMIGNTILLELELEPGKYVKISNVIEEFEVDDVILHYYSPIGNNAVPYPTAIGEKYVYDILNLKYYPIELYNEDVSEEDKFDFWHILTDSGESTPIEGVKMLL